MEFPADPELLAKPTAFDLALRSALKSMDLTQKHDFIHQMDLHEPVARLTRLIPATPGRRYVESHVSFRNVFGAILASGDREAINIAMGSHSLLAAQPMIRGHGFEDLCDAFFDVAFCEAASLGDAASLEIICEKAKNEKISISQIDRLGVLANIGTIGTIDEHNYNDNYGRALYDFALHADGCKQSDVDSCAAWFATKSLQSALVFTASNAAKSKSALEDNLKLNPTQAVLKAKTIQGLLHLASRHGSTKLAKSAIKLGARGSLEAAAFSFENGNPELAAQCLSDWTARRSDAFSSWDENYLAMGLKKRHEKTNSYLTPLSELFGSFCDNLDRLWDACSIPETKEAKLKHIAARAPAFREFFLRAAALPVKSPSEIAKQGSLAGHALVFAHLLPEPAAFVREIRGLHPLPAPGELSLIYTRAKKTLFKTRVADAARALKALPDEAGETWRTKVCETALGLMRESWELTVLHKKPLETPQVLFAMDLSCADLGWKTLHPASFCSKLLSPGSSAFYLKTFSKYEACLIQKAAAGAKSPSKPASRL